MTDKTKAKAARDIAPLEQLPEFEVSAPEPPVAHHKRRFGKEDVPPGFIRHRGKNDPVGNDLALVHLIIKTATGLGFAGPRQVHSEEWAIPEGEFGRIEFYQRTGVAPDHRRMFHPAGAESAPE